MKKKAMLLLPLLLCLFGEIYAQADPGSASINFNRTSYSKDESGLITVHIGNYSGTHTLGANLNPYDAIFVISIPSVFAVTGAINFVTNGTFSLLTTKQSKTATGTTEITVTSPTGIPKGEEGKVEIPVTATAFTTSILFTTVLTIGNQTTPPSGNVDPSNDFRFSPVYVVSPLPVTLLDFHAVKEQTTVHLNWSTSDETKSKSFDIERSSSGKLWEVIGSVQAQGESNTRHAYYFTDSNPHFGSNYYRLKMIDLDQTFSFSKITQLRIEEFNIRIFPNPVCDFLTIETGDIHGINRIRIVDINGLCILDLEDKISSVVDVRTLNAGTHLLQIQKTDGTTWTQRLLVSKGR